MRNSTDSWMFSDYQWLLLYWPLVKENKGSGYEVEVIGFSLYTSLSANTIMAKLTYHI